MHLRADFARPETVLPKDYVWTQSPAGGVTRMMLDRIGEEVARATSIVRFEPGSAFDAHTHGGGEEFLVLEGVFSDETGDFPAGHYVRNPIGTRHRPHTDPGCTIFVKLYQFDPADTAQVHIDTNTAKYQPGPAEGIEVLQLHEFGTEKIRMLRLLGNDAEATIALDDGGEVLVVDGAARINGKDCDQGAWMRLPAGSGLTVGSTSGALVFLKTGHLRA